MCIFGYMLVHYVGINECEYLPNNVLETDSIKQMIILVTKNRTTYGKVAYTRSGCPSERVNVRPNVMPKVGMIPNV